MGTKIDDLEKSINELIDQTAVESTLSPDPKNKTTTTK
jgi:hypothetical protein